MITLSIETEDPKLPDSSKTIPIVSTLKRFGVKL
jgi:hypothetical protein